MLVEEHFMSTFSWGEGSKNQYHQNILLKCYRPSNIFTLWTSFIETWSQKTFWSVKTIASSSQTSGGQLIPQNLEKLAAEPPIILVLKCLFIKPITPKSICGLLEFLLLSFLQDEHLSLQSTATKQWKKYRNWIISSLSSSVPNS